MRFPCNQMHGKLSDRLPVVLSQSENGLHHLGDVLGVCLLLDLLDPLEVLGNCLAIFAAPACLVQFAADVAKQLGQDLHVFMALTFVLRREIAILKEGFFMHRLFVAGAL